SATWRREFREPFEPLVPGFRHVPFNDVEALAKAVDGDTAAVILEAVQGEGGVHVASPEYLPAAREACDRAGALLIIDEVQTGMGRTGRLFAVERWGVQPDLLTLAKSLAGGVPIGATLATEEVERAFKGSHTSTFGGNPLACAAGTAAIEYTIREKLPERAERLGLIGVDAIRGFDSPSVREVRGLGLMIGVELRGKAAPVLQALQDDGVLAIGVGAVGEARASPGARGLIQHLARPDVLRVGGPSGWDSATIGYKGNLSLIVRVQGERAHPAAPEPPTVESGLGSLEGLRGFCETK